MTHVYFARLIKIILEISFIRPEFKPRDLPIRQTSFSICRNLETRIM